MRFKDLSLFKKILVIIYLILISPLLLIVELWFLIRVPWEYPIYKCSRYYKKYKEKYSVGITSDYYYKVINYLEKEKIDYDNFNLKEKKLVIKNVTYLFPWFEYISFDKDGNCIVSEQDNYEPTLLSEESKIKNKKNIKILIHKKQFKKSDLKMAKNNKILIVYNKLSDLKQYFIK